MPAELPLKLLSPTAAEILARYTPADEARAVLVEGASPQAFVAALTTAGRHLDALPFWAHALPGREAVWWACLCLAEAPGPAPKPAAAEAIAAARNWVREPDDAKRRECYRAGAAAGLDQAGGLVASAVYFTGGSIAPPELPEVAPAEHVAGDLLGAAVTLAAVKFQPERAAQTVERFLALGLEVAKGQKPWDS